MSRFAKLARNIGSNYAATAVHGLIFVGLTPFVVSVLGPVAYGVWVLIRTVDFYLGYLDLGLGEALRKYLAEYEGRADLPGIDRLVGTALVSHMVLGLAAGATAFALAALPLAAGFDIPPAQGSAFVFLLVAIGVSQVLRFPTRVLSGIYVGFQRFDVANAAICGIAVIRALATLAVLSAGFGLIGLAWLEIGIAALALVTNVGLVRVLFPSVRIGLPRFDTEMWRRLRAFGIWSFLDDVLTEGSAQLDKLLIPALFSVSLLAPYSLTVSLAALVLVASTPIADVLMPLSSELDARRDTARLRRLTLDGIRACIGVAAPVAAIVAALGPAVLELWVPIDYSALSPLVLPVLVANLFLSAIFWPATTLLLGSGQARLVFWYSLVEVGAIVALIVALAPVFGLLGCVIGIGLANAGAGFGLTFPSVARAVGLSRGELVRSAVLRPLAACVPTALVAYAVRAEPGATLVALAGAAACVGAVHAAGYVYLGYSASERTAYLTQLRTAVGLSA